jgi:peptide/nickel transport system substrate-binding protein
LTDAHHARAPGHLSRRTFLRRTGLALGGLTTAQALAACGGSRLDDLEQQREAAATGPQQRGGVLVLGVDAMTGNADPGIFAGFADWMAVDLVARGLTTSDFRTSEIRPALAEGWETSRDGRTYVFTIRDGPTFHDGAPVTARDFERSWRRMFDEDDPTRDPATFGQFLLGFPNTRAFRALDERRFEIRLVDPDVSLPAKCSVQAGVALSADAIERRGKEIGRRPVGAGPFRMTQFTPDQNARFERFDDFHEGPPFLDGVTMQIVPEPTALASAVRSSAIQASNFVLPSSVPGLAGAADVARGRPYTVQFAFLNVGSPALRDVRVRQAVNAAIDRRAIINSGFSGQAVAPAYVIPPTVIGHDPGLRGYSTQDLARARALVAEAGAQGQRVRVLAPNNRWWPNVGQVIEANLRGAGLEPVMEYLDQAAFGSKIYDPAGHDIALDTYAAVMPDPDDQAATIFQSGGIFAQAITQSVLDEDVSRRVDELILRGRAEADPARRAPHYVRMQRILAEELAPMAILAYTSAPVASAQGVLNLNADALGSYRCFLEEASLAA